MNTWMIPATAASGLVRSLAVIVLLGACAHRTVVHQPASEDSVQDTSSSEIQLTGTVVITGTEVARQTTLHAEGQRSVTLVGDLEPELRRLSGATVQVTGRDAGAGPLGRRVDVQRYDVLSIDGERPYVGVLLAQGGQLSLATASDTLPILAAPETLRERAGAKVWVIGPRTDAGVQLQSYGVIRPNPR